MKINQKQLIVIGLILLALASFSYVTWWILGDFDTYSSRRVWTITNVSALTSYIEQFKERQERFPESISELKGFIKDKNEFNSRRFMEFISDANGLEKESSILDNSGGWYYNKENGELKVNLTMPLKQYFKNCRYRKDEIPANW
jgi:hypothetical protein